MPAESRWTLLAWGALGVAGTAVQLAITSKKEDVGRTFRSAVEILNLKSEILNSMEAAWTFERKVEVDWAGSVMEGKGTAKAGSGAFNLPVTFPARIGESGGKTSPEELMAAAHAACYAMALNATLGRKGASADRTRRHRDRGRRQGRRRHQDHVVEADRRRVRAEGDGGGQFPDVAYEAEGKCPVSNAYRGSMQITVDAKVA